VESQCLKVRLRPGSVERVRDWAAELNRRRDEVLATLRDEGVLVEAAFLDRTTDGDFLIVYMKARSLEAAREVGRRSSHPIDEIHQRFKHDTTESIEVLEPQIDFDTIDPDALVVPPAG
jgi:hypothetical protein